MIDFISIINARKSVRNYTGAAIPQEDVKVIAESAILAPNAMNKQGWHFSVVTDAALLQKMSDACKKALADCPVPFLKEKAAAPDFNAFFHAPCVIVISIAEDKFTFFDAGAAAENICLAAKALGYGTCITASTEFMFAGDPGLKAELQIPEDYKFACAITVGTEAAGPDDHVRSRNKDVISYF